MDLNLEQRFNEQELNEIRKRAFSFAEQLFLEGISVGRELNREEIYDTTEQFVRDKISAMTAYFIRDDLWRAMPPHGYNPNPDVDMPVAIDDYTSNIAEAIETAKEHTKKETLDKSKKPDEE